MWEKVDNTVKNTEEKLSLVAQLEITWNFIFNKIIILKKMDRCEIEILYFD